MQVFISWSGQQTVGLGSALKAFLTSTFAGHVETFLSAEDIAPGERFNAVITESLESSALGILLVTKWNQTSPWLLFEAGALALKAARGSVVPILIGMDRADLLSPLNQFQNARGAERSDFLQVCERIRTSTNMPLDSFQTLFDAHWPALEAAFRSAAEGDPAESEGGEEVRPRSVEDMVREILLGVTSLSRSSQQFTPFRGSGDTEDTDVMHRAVLYADGHKGRVERRPDGVWLITVSAPKVPTDRRLRDLRSLAMKAHVAIDVDFPEGIATFRPDGRATVLGGPDDPSPDA